MYYMFFHNFLSNILFYLFNYINSQFKSMLKKKIFLLIIYSLNLTLCLHLAINSLLLFNNFFGSGKSKMCIFSSRHRLHLLSNIYIYIYIYIYNIYIYIYIYMCVCVCVHLEKKTSFVWKKCICVKDK